LRGGKSGIAARIFSSSCFLLPNANHSTKLGSCTFAPHETCDSPQKAAFFEITGFHGGEYEDDSLLGYCAVQSIRSWPTFQRCILPPSSGRSPGLLFLTMEEVRTSETVFNF
jgi:hypothetical protein